MMKLNRKTRRARGTWRRPSPTDTPQQQMKAFLKSPGKFHIVQLPEGKSFVVKVTDQEMPIFLTICQQLRGVLGMCDAIPATPVEAHVSDTTEIAHQTGEASRRIREARARQDAAETTAADAQTTQDGREAAIQRHPAGKQRGGRHRANEPETVFDRLVAAGPVDNDEGAKRLAAMEIAAAHDAVAQRQADLDAANQHLADAMARGGELHNRSVLDRFAERASQAIAEDRSLHVVDDHPRCTGHDPAENQCTLPFGHPPPCSPYRPIEIHHIHCPRDECGWSQHSSDKGKLAQLYGEHVRTHAKADGHAAP